MLKHIEFKILYGSPEYSIWPTNGKSKFKLKYHIQQ